MKKQYPSNGRSNTPQQLLLFASAGVNSFSVPQEIEAGSLESLPATAIAQPAPAPTPTNITETAAEDIQTVKNRVLAGAGRWERHYIEKSFRYMAEMLTGPITCGRNEDLSRRHGDSVVFERITRTMQLLNRHSEEIANTPPNEREEKYRLLAHDFDEKPLTNWETLLQFSAASAVAPLPHWAASEMKRAFAHCFGFEMYVKIMGTREKLHMGDLELARYEVGWGNLPPLDEKERAFVERLNAEIDRQSRGETLANELFTGVKNTNAI